jgi:hypothetical protein
MHQQRTNSSNVRSLRRTQQCVLAQSFPKASALVLKVRYGTERGGTINFPVREIYTPPDANSNDISRSGNIACISPLD